MSSELSARCYDEPEQIRGAFEELIGTIETNAWIIRELESAAASLIA